MNKNNSIVIPDNPWASSRSELLKELHVYKDRGLDPVMVARRNKQFDTAPNRQSIAATAWKTLTVQFKVFIILLLLVMMFALLVLGQWSAGAMLFIITVLFVTFEFLAWKKIHNTARIEKANNLKTRVRRNGERQEIPTDKLLPGDVVLLQPGDVVSADLRLIEVSNLQMDESTITGDPTPVDKQIELLEAEVPLTQRTNMAFKGTLVASGSGEGIVVALGADTTLNKIAT